jgi:hypothetical protein
MAYFVYLNETPFAWPSQQPPALPQPPAFATRAQAPPAQLRPFEPPVGWGKVIVGLGLVSLVCYTAYKAFEPATSTRRCSVCGSVNHDRRNCPHDGRRIPFSGSIPKSRICECCGGNRGKQRHHTRGRSDGSDFLDLCNQCHLHCGHKGNFQNLSVKPRYCVITGRTASWRTM